MTESTVLSRTADNFPPTRAIQGFLLSLLPLSRLYLSFPSLSAVVYDSNNFQYDTCNKT